MSEHKKYFSNLGEQEEQREQNQRISKDGAKKNISFLSECIIEKVNMKDDVGKFDFEKFRKMNKPYCYGKEDEELTREEVLGTIKKVKAKPNISVEELFDDKGVEEPQEIISDMQNLENVGKFDFEKVRKMNKQHYYGKEDEELTREEVLGLVKKVRAKPNIFAEELFEDEVFEESQEIISDVKRLKEIAGAYNYAKSVMQKKKYCILGYDDSMTGLYAYNGHCWQPVDKEALMNDAYSVLSEDTRNNTDSINKLCRNIADYVRLNVVYDFHEGDKAFCSEDFNTINNRIVFQNGVYDVATGERCDFDSSLPYYMEVDCKYKEKDKSTPYYDKLKYDATGGDEDSMEMIDLMIAYLLIPNRSGKCFFIMSNAKDSGKSILGQFIESLFKGDVCQTIDPEHFSGRFAFAGAEKTALYTCLEMSTDRLSKAAVAGIKRITGERKMRVEQKYQDVKTVDIRCKLLLASNGGLYLPKNTEDDAFYRRMIVIPFIKSTPLENMIADLPQKLQEEKSAIVSNAVRKLRKYISLDGGIVFPESELSKLIKNSWMGKNLYDELFVRNELVYTGNLTDRIAKSDIYLRYLQYYCSEEVRDDMPAMCSRDALIKLIKNIYPQVLDKKARCSSVEKPDNKAKPCIHGIRWCVD